MSFKNIRYYFLLLLAFFLPVNEKISTILIVLNVVLALFEIKKFKGLKYFYPLILIFILFGVAYYKDTYQVSIILFEQKASFLGMPIVFATLNLSKNQIVIVLKAFAYGCLAICIISFLYAFFRSFQFNPFRFYPYSLSKGVQDITLLEELPLQTHHFLGYNFAFNMQTLYAAMYYIYAILIFYIFTKKTKLNVFFIILIFTSIVLVFSEMGLLVLGLFLIFFIKRKLKKTHFIVLISLGFIAVLYLGRHQISNLNKAFKVDDVEEENRYFVRVNERLAIWNSITKIEKNKLIFGIGYRKAQKELNRKYELAGYYAEPILSKNLNAHNTYLQTLIEIGIIGLLLIVFMFFQLYRKIKLYDDKNLALIANSFLILTLINLITESMFTRYLGLSFILFFYSLFMFSFSTNSLQKPID